MESSPMGIVESQPEMTVDAVQEPNLYEPLTDIQLTCSHAMNE